MQGVRGPWGLGFGGGSGVERRGLEFECLGYSVSWFRVCVFGS